MAGVVPAVAMPVGKLRGENRVMFERGVEGVFESWTALQLCRQNAESDKADKVAKLLVNDIKEWFAKDGEVYSDEIETYLEGEIDETLSTEFEDGSIKEVADCLNKMYRECSKGEFEMVKDACKAARNQGAVAASGVEKGYLECDADGNVPPPDDPSLEAPKLAPVNELPDKELLEEILAEVRVQVASSPAASTLTTRSDLLLAVNKATCSLLTASGIPIPNAAPPKKTKKTGKNRVEVSDDGWSTVK